MITFEPSILIIGYTTGLVLGTIPSLIGFIINSVFRWMGY